MPLCPTPAGLLTLSFILLSFQASWWHISFPACCPCPEHWALQTVSTQCRWNPAPGRDSFQTVHRGTSEHCSELTGVPQDIPNFGEKHSDTQHLSDVGQDRCSV